MTPASRPPRRSKARSPVRWLALLPCLGILIGTPFVNSAAPSLFGMPLILVWLSAWVLLTSLVMAVVYATDPANRGDPGTDEER
jgi:hypothetical protein